MSEMVLFLISSKDLISESRSFSFKLVLRLIPFLISSRLSSAFNFFDATSSKSFSNFCKIASFSDLAFEIHSSKSILFFFNFSSFCDIVYSFSAITSLRLFSFFLNLVFNFFKLSSLFALSCLIVF